MVVQGLTWFKRHPILTFYVLSFSLAWGIWLPVGLWMPNSLIVYTLPGAWAPNFAALWVVGLTEGWPGVRGWLTGLLRWRVGVKWYLVVLFGIPALAYLSIGLYQLFGGVAPDLTLPPGVPRDGWLVALPIIFLINIFVGGPLAEEPGWRGYVLPRLRQRLSLFTAGVVSGVLWAVWHLPFFVFADAASVVGRLPFVWFALLVTAWSVLLAWVYAHTRSVLLCILAHAAANTTLGTLGILGQQPNETLLILHVFLTWAVVACIVAVNGRG